MFASARQGRAWHGAQHSHAHYRQLAAGGALGTCLQGKPLAYVPPPIFAPVMTIAHEINAGSPLHGKTLEDIAAGEGPAHCKDTFALGSVL